MSLVGNDVVDLDDVAPASVRLRERFVARVCAPSERELLARSSDPQLLWCLFAAKEAAFKVASKLGEVPVFAHRRFVVADDLRSVTWLRNRPKDERLTFSLRLEVDGRCIHAVAWLGAVEPVTVRAFTGARDDGRRALLDATGGDEIARAPRPESWDDLGPPRVLRAGAPLPIDVSLSHDGRFTAFAVSAPNG